MLRESRDAMVNGVLVVVDAARLLVRHFPALLSVFLLGTAVHNAILWGAVRIGRDHPVVATLLLPLAPFAMVVAMVTMLRIAARALTADDDDRSASRRLAVLTSALVPFLTVYAVTGELTRDREQFLNESFADEFYRGALGSADGLGDRSIVTLPHLQLIFLLVFLAIRLVIDVLDLEERHTAWGLVQTYVEVTWLVLFATYFSKQLIAARDWAGDFVVVSWWTDAWHWLTDSLGPLADPLRAAADLFSRTIEGVGPILVTPLAWLAVGVVVIVGGLPAGRRRRAALPEAATQVHSRVTRRLRRVGSGRAGSKLLELMGRRFEDLLDAVRVLTHAGLLPVLTFCLVLPLARIAEWGAAEALRAVVGPRDPETMVLFSRYPDVLLSAAYTLPVVVIVVAAVDRLLVRVEQEEPEQVRAG